MVPEDKIPYGIFMRVPHDAGMKMEWKYGQIKWSKYVPSFWNRQPSTVLITLNIKTKCPGAQGPQILRRAVILLLHKFLHIFFLTPVMALFISLYQSLYNILFLGAA